MPDLLSGWTLQGGANVPAATPASALGIPSIVFAFKSKVPDTAAFTIPVAAADADPLFAFGDTVSIRQGGAQVFVGTLQSAPEAVMTGTAESQRFTLLGPWWYLENVVYQQGWAQKTPLGLINTERSHLVLCQDQAGNRITTGAQISDALQWARAAGALFQIGDILPGVLAPTRDASDLTCAEVVKTMLRWTPDVVTWFDYSTTPPTLHMQRRADLTPASLPMTSAISKSLTITARHDLQVPSVTLKYEQQNTDDTDTWTTTTSDTYPVGANEQTVKALVQTLQLSGSQTTRQKQSVVTRPIPASDASAPTVIDWWLDRNPWLKKAGISADKLTLVAGSWYSVMDPVGQLAADGKTALDDAWTVDDLPNEVVGGTITPWMEKTWPSLKTGALTLGCCLSYSGDITDIADPQQRQLVSGWFNMGNASDPNYNLKWFFSGVTATNAQNQVYTAVVEQSGGEPIPFGLAEQIYIALNTLHYEGSFVTTEEEIGGAVGLGNVLNLTGGRAEWAAMNAMVQEVSWEGATGTTTLKFGPPEHLSAQDMVEFLRGIRQSRGSIIAAGRATGVASGSPTVDGAGKGPNSRPNNPPGGGAAVIPPLHLVDASTSAGTKVQITWGTIGNMMFAGMSNGDTPPYILSVSGDGSVWAVVNCDADGVLTSVAAASGVSYPTDDSPTQGYLLIGTYKTVTSGGKTALRLTSNLAGSQSYARCRDWFSDSNTPVYTHTFGAV